MCRNFMSDYRCCGAIMLGEPCFAVGQEFVIHLTARASLRGTDDFVQIAIVRKFFRKNKRCPVRIRSLILCRCSRARRSLASVGVLTSVGRYEPYSVENLAIIKMHWRTRKMNSKVRRVAAGGGLGQVGIAVAYHGREQL